MNDSKKGNLLLLLAAIFGALLLNETMSVREILGSAIIFAAVIIGQFEFGKERKHRTSRL